MKETINIIFLKPSIYLLTFLASISCYVHDTHLLVMFWNRSCLLVKTLAIPNNKLVKEFIKAFGCGPKSIEILHKQDRICEYIPFVIFT